LDALQRSEEAEPQPHLFQRVAPLVLTTARMAFKPNKATNPAAAAALKALGGIAGTFGVAFGSLAALTGVCTGVSRYAVVRQKKAAGQS